MSHIHLSRADQIKLLRDIDAYAAEREIYLDKVHFDDDLIENAKGKSSYLNSMLHDYHSGHIHTEDEIEDIRKEMIEEAAYRDDVRREYYAVQGA